MDPLFLRELPVVSLADGNGDSQQFVVDFPEPRPSFEHVKLMTDKWRAQIVEKVTEAMNRKKLRCLLRPIYRRPARLSGHFVFQAYPDLRRCQEGRQSPFQMTTRRSHSWCNREGLAPLRRSGR